MYIHCISTPAYTSCELGSATLLKLQGYYLSVQSACMGTDLDTVCAEIYPLYIQHITSLVEYLVGQGVLQLSQLTPDALSALSGEQPD